MSYNVKQQIRTDTPQVGYAPYRQVHAHSTGNSGSTAQNEADYMGRKDLNTGFYTHVVGNGQVIQVAPVNRGAWDVGGGYNYETYAAVELIESHGSKDEFMRDYKIYCELLYDLAKQAGIPTTLDTGDLAGIKTHNYCTHNQPNNGSDHVDPIPYLTKWGITQQQFANDIANCKGNSSSNGDTNNGNSESNKGDEEEMMLFKIVDTTGAHKGKWFISNGTHLRYIRTPRMLASYQNQYAKMNLKTDSIYSSELFGKKGEFDEKNVIW
ncbi:N-acetylmuramoyl-L-alanine amidase [Lactococcus petauri]|uniref:N-acetylmuramoyl-L-alanine amidase n=2 Tax=Lactococcus TaxID=1357 RepID=UPI0028930C09|nr:N-acetylmuramoyl-L-alanine amidase [Lactococcus petauri]